MPAIRFAAPLPARIDRDRGPHLQVRSNIPAFLVVRPCVERRRLLSRTDECRMLNDPCVSSPE